MARQIEESPNLLEMVQQWMVRYQNCIRQKKYQLASELFHPKAVSFGVFKNDSRTPRTLEDSWEDWNIWKEFTFDMASAAIMPMAGGIMVGCKWKAQSLLLDSVQKHGRATFLFCLFDNGVFKALHEHISVNPCT